MRHQRKIAPMSEEDRAFFDDFLVKYGRFISFTAQKYKCPGILWDDIRQEAIIKLIYQIPKLRNMHHNAICSYISFTVQTAFLDLQRKETRHSHVSMDPILEEMIGTERNLVPDLFMRQELQRLRKHLTGKEWFALKGKYIFGYSQEELGKHLGMAPDSVRTFLCRVRKQSRQILSPEKVAGGDGDD